MEMQGNRQRLDQEMLKKSLCNGLLLPTTFSGPSSELAQKPRGWGSPAKACSTCVQGPGGHRRDSAELMIIVPQLSMSTHQEYQEYALHPQGMCMCKCILLNGELHMKV